MIMEHFLDTLKLLTHLEFTTQEALVVEEAIHLRFKENKPNNDLSKLDESFADLRLDNDSIETSSTR